MTLDPTSVSPCLNCGQALCGPYCHHCGQRHQEGNLAIKHIFKDVVHDILHFDAKVFQTLKLLIGKPGLLTVEYLSGKRTRHVPPFRLYIFVSFLLFSLLAFEKSSEKRHSKRDSSPIVFNIQSQEEPAKREAASGTPEAATARESPNALPPSWERKLEHATKDPEAFKRHLQHRISQAMFVLLPGFALLLAVLYRRQRRFFVEHMIFSIHVHTFFFLVFITQWLLGRLPSAWGGCLGSLLILALPVHLGLSMGRVYDQGTFKTLLKGALLSASYLLVVGIVLLGVVVLTAMEH